nr:hypothetical protein [Solobacterium sp.]
ASSVSYSLLTNTHLYTTYTYNGTEYTDSNDKGDNAMELDVEAFTVVKEWNNELDDRDADSVNLIVTKDGKTYLDDVTVSKSSNPAWTSKTVYIACGYISTTTSGYTVKEVGHDYTVIEPEEYAYYWDLTAAVYHPMMIDGTAKMLILNDKATGTDGTDYYTINGHKYEVSTETSNVLTATNDRRSNLNLTKTVDVKNTPSDDMFEYTVTIGETDEDDIWFSAYDADGSIVYDLTVSSAVTAETGTLTESDVLTDISYADGYYTYKYNGTEYTVPAADDGTGSLYYTGYYYVAAGTEFTLEIAKDWNVRFINLPTGTEYSIEETSMPDYYSFVSVAAEASNAFSDTTIKDSDWYTIDSTNTDLITGTIIEANNCYTITYTNTFGAFYVYHSGVAEDGNLEVVKVPENNGTYDLTQNVTTGTLYGGYYLDYAGKGDYADDGVKGTTGEIYTGMNYTWSNPQTVIGTAITPTAGETYYIKEVPTYYLRNYYQINFMRSTGELKALYLISAVDDANYQEAGFILKSTDSQKAEVVKTMTFRNYSTNKSVTLKANTVFRSLGITGDGSENNLLDYYDTTANTNYFKVGSFTMLPYWKTPDGITVNGISTRTVTITSLTKSGITKSDS